MISPEALGLCVLGSGLVIGPAVMKFGPVRKPEPVNGNAPVTKEFCRAVHTGLDKRIDAMDNCIQRVEEKIDRLLERSHT